LHLLGVPVPDDMDGRVLTEILEPMYAQSSPVPILEPAFAGAQAHGASIVSAESIYSDEDDAAIQQRLADLGYL
jgi:hypothetical protein